MCQPMTHENKRPTEHLSRNAAAADEIVVTWPSGKTSKLTNVAAGSKIVVKEAEAAPAATAST